MNLRALQLIVTQGNWAIEPSWYELGSAIIAGELQQVEALIAKRGEAMGVMTEKRGSVAILNIYGAIYSRGSLMADLCDAPTPESILRDFTAAVNDPFISAIVLNIESPGGVVAGTAEVADAIYAARGKKPIIAYAASLAASAAYWIASAADAVVINKTAQVGSIGVVAGYYKNPNSNILEFVSSQSPKKRLDPMSESGRAAIQANIDSLAAVFVSDVARNRGVSAETVLKDFGQGDVLVGKAAEDAGLVDALGSFEQVVSDLASGKAPKRKPKMAQAASAEAEQENEDMKFSELLAKLGISLDDAKAELATPAPAADETAKLEAALAAERAEKEALIAKQQADADAARQAEAKAFAETIIASNRALPADREAIEAGYAHCATNQTALAAFKSGYETRQPHGLTEEQLKPKGLQVLLSSEPSEEEQLIARTYEGAVKFAQQRNGAKA